MQGITVFYLGHDIAFDKRLDTSSQTLGCSYKSCDFPAKALLQGHKLDCDILFAHCKTIEQAEIATKLIPTRSVLILVTDDQKLDFTAKNSKLWDNYFDVILSSHNQSFLDKKLAMYLEYFENTPRFGRQGQSNSLIKKNYKLSRHVDQLQQQVSKAQQHHKTQTEVLDKIKQISILSRQINCLDRDKIAAVCIDSLPKLISARFASLYVFDPASEILTLLRHNHPYEINQTITLDKHSQSPMAVAVRQKHVVLIKDFTQADSKGKKVMLRLFVDNYRSNSCIIAPLMSGDNILGVLNLADKIGDNQFDEERDLPPLTLLCDIIGSAMSNIRMYDEVHQQARSDSMTGLMNHRTFYRELAKEVGRSRRYGSNLSLVMVDLDNLKAINDTYGHRAGDAVLMHVAEQISHCIRGTDIAARYGGDEFAIVLPNTSLSDAVAMTQRLRRQVAEHPIRIDQHDIDASVSIGMGQYQPEWTVEDFMNESDTALFEAKAAGKNQIHVFQENNRK